VPENRAFDQQELERARLRPLGPEIGARQFFVKSPEDLVLRKLEWYRAGGHSSQHQWDDVLGVLKVQRADLDREYLAHWAGELGLTDLLDRALAKVDDWSGAG